MFARIRADSGAAATESSTSDFNVPLDCTPEAATTPAYLAPSHSGGLGTRRETVEPVIVQKIESRSWRSMDVTSWFRAASDPHRFDYEAYLR